MGSDLTVVNAARVSFAKHKEWIDTSDIKLIRYLAEHNHWTPFAHPQIMLRMQAPVPIRTQCFKHKQGFVENEVSRRYVDDSPSFFYPDTWRGRPTDGAKQGSSDVEIKGLYQYTNDCGDRIYEPIKDRVQWLYDMAEELYSEMIIEGVAPEQARLVLPQAMMTEWYWTGSLAAYARFANLRLDPHAQKEIQDLAKMVSDVIEPLFPYSWEALTSGS